MPNGLKKTPKNMRTTTDKEREERIENEIVVDAYGPEERSLGWYYYLDENIHFPLTGSCIEKLSISPLILKEKVEVTGMASEEECEDEMFVEIVWNERTFDVPLSQISPVSASEKTKAAIEDWHYWVKQKYEF